MSILFRAVSPAAGVIARARGVPGGFDGRTPDGK